MTTKRKTTIWTTAFIVLTAIASIFIIKTRKSPDPQNVGTFSFPALTNTAKISLKVFETERGWAYEIYADKTLFIVQATIPGIPGHKSFINKKDAEKCGKLVISKLKKGENPSVSKEELDKLEIEIPN